ncbi:hypothetical protein SAMN05216275_103151 [Streptosporangium canum]|uniref:Uncharacterized protein n=1 Tax=Streptosporangium canum TaxID=324952 RepID=A0A1I3I616_9ACTN|nr:hypothetical protein SAMN05216275_103151 [Streptosporangium canum]
MSSLASIGTAVVALGLGLTVRGLAVRDLTVRGLTGAG